MVYGRQSHYTAWGDKEQSFPIPAGPVAMNLCGRHLEGIYQYVQAYNDLSGKPAIEYRGVSGYQELFVDAPKEELGGSWLGSFLL